MKKNFKKDGEAQKKKPVILLIIPGIIFASLFFCLFFLIKNFSHSLIPALVFLFVVLAATIALIVISSKISSLDKLTQIPSMASFQKKCFLKFRFRNPENYYCLFMNIKGCKYINRIIGDRNGDLVIRKYAQTLLKLIKKDEVLGRPGGDNFTALIQKKHLGAFLSQIKLIEVPIIIDGKEKFIPVSVYTGISEAAPGDSFYDVLGKASIAIEALRSRGTKNADDYLFFNAKIADEIYKEKQISYMFQDALINNEFKVYYQPKVNMNTNKLTGCEALVRWSHDGEIIAPDDFIPALEHTGLIVNLDFFVMNQVCNDINSWKAKGINCVPVATNFSKIHIQNPDFAKEIIKILNFNNTDKSLFQIELTESSNYEDYESLITFLEMMSKENIATAIDDFGIGFSSLSLLKNPNVKIVKIDKSFIDNIELNNGKNQNMLLVQNIVNTCHDLKKEIICEGIENNKQKELLEKLDCSIIQGFLYDKPLTYEDFETRLINPDYQ